jgi:hypothetical protein
VRYDKYLAEDIDQPRHHASRIRDTGTITGPAAKGTACSQHRRITHPDLCFNGTVLEMRRNE